MPTYAYRCRKCGRRFELFHGIKDDSPKRCPRCRGRADRVPAGGVGILFKGSGFYATDYRSPSYREKAKQERAVGGAGGASEGKGGTSEGKGGASEGKGGASEGKGGASEGKRATKRTPPATDKGAGSSSE